MIHYTEEDYRMNDNFRGILRDRHNNKNREREINQEKIQKIILSRAGGWAWSTTQLTIN